MLQGWKSIHQHVCTYMRREFSLDTVRKWKWLEPAIEDFNGRVAAPSDAIEKLVDARRRPRLAA